MKTNPYVAENTNKDYETFSNMIEQYLSHALENDTPETEVKRGVRELLSMMFRIMPKSQKYIQYISSRYWTEKALEYADFYEKTPNKTLTKINESIFNEVKEKDIKIKKGRSALVLEHAVPVKILSKNIIEKFKNGESILDYIKNNFIFVTCSKIEDAKLNEAGYQSKMPDESDIWSRYKAAGITVYDTLLNVKVC